jgi:hypothetical protein
MGIVAASWPWEWPASAWSAITFVVLLGAAVLTYWQVREARRLREDQARPFVVIDFFPIGGVAIEIRITNIGSTLARDVHFEFEPKLISTHDDEGGSREPVADLNLFKNGIPSLAPGREMKIFFDQFPARVERGLPMTYQVKIRYRDRNGKPLTDTTVLDLSMYLDTGGITRHGLHDIHKRLEEISKLLALILKRRSA